MLWPVSDEDTRLRAIGIEIITERDEPRVRIETLRVARRLHAAGRKVVGLIPSDDEVAVPPIAVQLGVALADLTGATVAYLDANVRWPAVSEVAAGESRSSESESLFATRWLRGSLALLTPRHAERAGDVLPQLERVLFDGVELFEYVLVDLSGFDLLGEHAAAALAMDGVILVARAGRSRETDLMRLRDEIDPDRLLGVMLVG